MCHFKLCMKFFLLILFSLNNSYGESDCLQISNFEDLESLTSFENESVWSKGRLIASPRDLTYLDNKRIYEAEGISGIEFMQHTGFDGRGIFQSRIKVLGSDREYDLYTYEAGDNGNGYIFAKNNSSVVAFISDGQGGEISGCLKY